MRVSASCKLRALGVALLALAVAGCPLPPRVPAPPPAAPPPAAPPAAPAPHEGVPYAIVAQESLLTIRAYRGGTLASAGHNHLIACHALSGTIYVPADLMRASFEFTIPVAELTVDEDSLRAAEMSADFAAQVPQSAREGTRRNMLGEALLDAANYPLIRLRALGVQPVTPPAGVTVGEAGVLADVEVTVRGRVSRLSVPVRYEIDAQRLSASGTVLVRQSELGLTPFSALLGALQVQDEMRISFRIIARGAAEGAPRN
jgi:polyisoprenoid-binding protein YceI